MANLIDQQRLAAAMNVVADELVGMMGPDGRWVGELSSSALSTATAISAMAIVDDPHDQVLIENGTRWLVEHQNGDGGWGDTTDSPSNLSTTLLCMAALRLGRGEGLYKHAVAAGRGYVQRHAGRTNEEIVAALRRLYGEDATFAAPILVNCALAGIVSWKQIPRLPFELAALPHVFYKALRLHVVSYALPVLIAIGLAIERHRPAINVFRALWRWLAKGMVLKKLAGIQPASGGFLEATPLTSFVAMSLAAAVGREHPVVSRCLGFLRESARRDGSWPIDTNLSVWVTTGAVGALAAAGMLDRIDMARTRGWLLACQHREVHPYTNSAPGGWAWTDLSGGVPDADDTSGALLALLALGGPQEVQSSLSSGSAWLLALQNADGGWPTFCRGWGKLPFDRSAPDLTAHAVRGLRCVGAGSPAVARAIATAIQYLGKSQKSNGAWLPLSFGNQAHPTRANPVIGTARVLRSYEALGVRNENTASGVEYLVSAQNADGGWGGGAGIASTMEETALAMSALAGWREMEGVETALAEGAEFLVDRVEQGSWRTPAPIGLYFASLWYSERLYPIIWTLEALGRMSK